MNKTIYILSSISYTLSHYCKTHDLDYQRYKTMLHDNWLSELSVEITCPKYINEYLKKREKEFIRESNKNL